MDDDMDALIKRTIRDIARAKIVKPGPGEYVDRCWYSKTGWAVHKGPGHCTCNPARAPKETR